MRKWRKCSGRKKSNRPCHFFGTDLVNGKYYCSWHKQRAHKIIAITDKELSALLLTVTTSRAGQRTDYKKLWLTVVPRLLNEIKRLKGKPL